MLKLSHFLFGSVLLLWILLPNQVSASQPVLLPTCPPFGSSMLNPSIAVSTDNTFFAAYEQKPTDLYVHYLRKSTDRGLTWQRLPDLPHIEDRVASITLSPNYVADHALAVAFGTAANLSTDGGATWRVIRFPRTGSANVFALGDARHLYVGYGQQIGLPVPMELWASTDGGSNWRRIYQGLEVRQIAVSPAFAQDHTLLIAIGLYHYNGGILKSTDAGVTWTRADAGIVRGGETATSVQFSPVYPTDHTLFYASSAIAEIGEIRVYKSIDAGASWRPMADPQIPSSQGGTFVISPRYRQDQTLWYISYYSSSMSRDGGQAWLISSYPLWLQTAAEYCQPTGRCGVELFGQLLQGSPSIGYYITSMYRSYDYGQTWQCLNDPTPPPTPIPPAPPTEIPEPSTLLLLGSGVAGWVAYGSVMRLRRKTAAR